MKIPDHVLDLMLIGAIGAICLVPHGTKTVRPTLAQPTATAPGCAIPAQAPAAAQQVDPATRPAQPFHVLRDPCPACGRG